MGCSSTAADGSSLNHRYHSGHLIYPFAVFRERLRDLYAQLMENWQDRTVSRIFEISFGKKSVNEVVPSSQGETALTMVPPARHVDLAQMTPGYPHGPHIRSPEHFSRCLLRCNNWACASTRIAGGNEQVLCFTDSVPFIFLDYHSMLPVLKDTIKRCGTLPSWRSWLWLGEMKPQRRRNG